MRKVRELAIGMTILAGLTAAAALHAKQKQTADKPVVDELWTTKKVMDKAHLGKQSLMAVVSKDMQQAEPDWKSDEANLAEIIRLMGMLTKQKPPRGSQEAWNKLVQEYVDDAKVARQSVKEHKLQPARAALEKVRSTCDRCHDDHGIQ